MTTNSTTSVTKPFVVVPWPKATLPRPAPVPRNPTPTVTSPTGTPLLVHPLSVHPYAYTPFQQMPCEYTSSSTPLPADALWVRLWVHLLPADALWVPAAGSVCGASGSSSRHQQTGSSSSAAAPWSRCWSPCRAASRTPTSCRSTRACRATSSNFGRFTSPTK